MSSKETHEMLRDLHDAKRDMKSAIEERGVTVKGGLSSYPDYIYRIRGLNRGKFPDGIAFGGSMINSENALNNLISRLPPNLSTCRNMFSHVQIKYTDDFIFPWIDTSNVVDMSHMFYDCNITSIPLLDTSNVIDMSYMLSTVYLTSVPLLDTSSVTDMTGMFDGCSKLTAIPLLDTSSVTNMTGMFAGCTSLTIIPLLDTSSVTDMSFMFNGCKSLIEIPLLDTSSVTNMIGMFSSCDNLTVIPLLDTSSVTNMIGMFSSCDNLTVIPLLDTSKVKFTGNKLVTYHDAQPEKDLPAADGMFWNCTALTTIPLLDTSNMVCMSGMFAGCNSLTTIPAFDTSSVTDMDYLFYGCTNLTSVPLLDVSNVNQMAYMFYHCDNLTHLGGFKNLGKGWRYYDTGSYGRDVRGWFLRTCANLTRESVINIFNNLYPEKHMPPVPDEYPWFGYAASLSLNKDVFSRLTDEDIAIATNKGWSIGWII